MRKLLLLVTAIALGSGCTVHNADVANPSGPSTLAISLSVTATPDTLPQNGVAVAQIQVKAFKAAGQPYPGLTIRLDTQVSFQTMDFGTLGTHTLVTDSDGTARTTYTAPPGPNVGGSGSTVAVLATPIAGDASSAGLLNSVGAVFQTIIRLTSDGVVGPTAQSPTPSFTNTPAATAGAVTFFDASLSCAAAAGSNNTCASTPLTITGYSWDFGDGTTGSGVLVSHTFANAGPYAVKLTVTNSAGRSSTLTKITTVAAPSAATPTAGFTALPNPAHAGDPVQLDASSSSTATDGVPIANYFWDFGDGSTKAGSPLPTTSHIYAVPGVSTNYVISLTVTDQKGRQSAAKLQTITVNP